MSGPDPIHIHPTAPLAERVLLPGDPGRALRLAQALIAEPKMFNHNRGLWGYSGSALADGAPLTIQSTGIGGPSAAIVLAELVDLGARRLVRVGTCGALDPALGLGDLVVVTEALATDGTSRALGAGARAAGDPRLTSSLLAAGAAAEAGAGAGAAAGAGAGLEPAAAELRVHHGPVVSTDLFYDGPAGAEQRWLADGALAVEMEAATVFALAARRGVEAGCVLAVRDLLLPQRRRIDHDALEAAELRLGRVAVGALAGAVAVAVDQA
jgi:purine-nucleoside phosphorylase